MNCHVRKTLITVFDTILFLKALKAMFVYSQTMCQSDFPLYINLLTYISLKFSPKP